VPGVLFKLLLLFGAENILLIEIIFCVQAGRIRTTRGKLSSMHVMKFLAGQDISDSEDSEDDEEDTSFEGRFDRWVSSK